MAAEPIIDKVALKEQFDGDTELLLEVKGILEEDCPEKVEAARKALAQGDAKGVADAAHSIKGAVSTLAAIPAREIAHQLEKAGRAGQLDQAPALLDSLEQELTRLFAELATLNSFD